jgi:hypothetical protein
MLAKPRRQQHDAYDAFRFALQRDALVTLLALGQEDLDALPAPKRQHLLAAMKGFVSELGLLVDSTSNLATDVPVLSIDDLRALQPRLREGLTALFPSEAWQPPLQWDPKFAIESIEIARGTHEFGLIYVVAWPGAFWFAAVKLLEHHGTSVERCQRCARLYVRTKRQTFCSAACAQRARSQKWYARHRDDVLDRRHETYRAKHPKQKIPRRTRVNRPNGGS